MSEKWGVEVYRNAENILTIEDSYLSGVENILEYKDTIRLCAKHLLSFIGEYSEAEKDKIAGIQGILPKNTDSFHDGVTYSTLVKAIKEILNA